MHIRDGWYFETREEGTVRVAKVSNSCTHEIVLSKSEWDSIKKEVAGPVVDRARGAKLASPPVKAVVSKSISPQSHAAVVAE